MVKNRALKRDARVVKASSGLTYPRARDQAQEAAPSGPYTFALGTNLNGPVIYKPMAHSHLLVSGRNVARTAFQQRIAKHAAATLKVYVLTPWATTVVDPEQALQEIVHTIADLDRQPGDTSLATHTMLVVDAHWLLLGSPERTDSDDDRATRLRMAVSFDYIARNAQRAGVVVVATVRDAGDARSFTATDTLLAFGSLLEISPAGARNGEPGADEAVFVVHGIGAARIPLRLPYDRRVKAGAYRYALGTSASGAAVSFSPARDVHLQVTGDPGSGKTRLLASLSADATKELDVYVCGSTDEIDTAGTAGSASTPEGIAGLLQDLVTEARGRHQLCDAADVARTDDLPVPLKRILVVIDDAWDLLSTRTGDEADNENRTRIAVLLGRLGRRAQRSGISLVVATGRPDAMLIPGGSEVEAYASSLKLDRDENGHSTGRYISSWGLRPSAATVKMS